ncbi:MAG: spore coat U domain-containing protein [Oxalicibacterium faecigallinarum]|uniref:Csu type fimbrial protein n=1 Tax=Oxalicibacterium faecigallinarum TaxID=573741 RepID=UPI001669A176|nr:spore coat U domain-containing protein [Oxalicibacterium faecigallinarum]MDQ7968211.1 spore coat U domain-containing protein [Oxalicibacterium faecigallinarum]
MSKLLKAVVVCSAALVSSASWSATASTTFQVTATILSSCTVAGTTLNFGSNIDPIAASVPLDSTSTLTVTCSNTTPYTVALSAGSNAGGATNFTSRAIKNGSSTLGYQLYTDSSRTTVWGNGTSSSSTVPGTGSGSNQTLSIYGRLPSLTGAVPGNYTDTVTVTITY